MSALALKQITASFSHMGLISFRGFLGFTAAIALSLTPVATAHAQTVSTVAGTGTLGSTGDGFAATLATLDTPRDVLVRRDGSVLISERFGNRVRKIDAAGVITTFAGTGTSAYTPGPALAAAATLQIPLALAEDAAGNVYIGSLGAIQKVDAGGTLTTIAGNGNAANTGDGFAPSAARVGRPAAMAFDAAGNLFFADELAQTVRKIDFIANTISHIAGVASTFGNSTDGNTAATTTLNLPRGLLVLSDGSLLIADRGSERVRKIIPGGLISTIAGQSGISTSTGDNGLATAATLNGPNGLAKDAAGNIYVTERFSNRVRKIAPNGIITTLLGTPAGIVTSISPLTNVDGALASATVRDPFAITLDAAGNIYVVSSDGNKVRKITFPPPVVIPGPSIFKPFANTITAANGSISPEGDQTVPFGGTVQVTVTAKPRHVLRVASNCDYVKTSAPIALVPNGTGTDTFAVTVNGPCSMEATFTPLIPKANVNSESLANALFTNIERSQVYAAPNPIVQTSSVVGATVKLKAWVTDIAGVPYPSATNVITFKANGAAISGCVNVPLALRASNVVHIREASCTTAFAAAGSVTVTSEFAGDTYNFPAVSGALNHSVVMQ